MSLFVDDSIQRIFRLREEGLKETQIPGKSGGEENYDAFSRQHNSIVGHLGVERTLIFRW